MADENYNLIYPGTCRYHARERGRNIVYPLIVTDQGTMTVCANESTTANPAPQFYRRADRCRTSRPMCITRGYFRFGDSTCAIPYPTRSSGMLPALRVWSFVRHKIAVGVARKSCRRPLRRFQPGEISRELLSSSLSRAA